jgi:polyisoprenoid-binding protein YceI
VAFLAVLLASCSVPTARHTPAPGPPRPAGQEQAEAGANYKIDASQSMLRVLVYRSGPLARFGHNHVMVNHALSGWVVLADPVVHSKFSLNIPAAEFVVDGARERREAGDDFPGEIDEDAIQGTQHNMLSAALLNAAQYPSITVDSAAIEEDGGRLSAAVTISLAGHQSRVVAPLVLQSDAHRLSARGTLELRQTDLGLTPFSLMMGALQVQDTMRLDFSIIATAS